MKGKKVILGLALSVSLGIIAGIAYEKVNVDNEIVSADKVEQASDGWVQGEQALEKIPFKAKVKLPEQLPFDVNSSFSEDVDLAYVDKKAFRKTFLNNEKSSHITIEVTEANIIPATANPEEQPLKEVKLENGIKAKYLDNGTFQFLYWRQDGLSYKIEAQKEYKNKSKKFTKNELAKIASSLK